MIKIEYGDTWGFEHTARGMRNSYGGWNKSDSYYCMKDDVRDESRDSRSSYEITDNEDGDYLVERSTGVEFFPGNKDLRLMQKLVKAGSPHRKFLRQIFVSMEITAPLYWWEEFDAYKVGTTANSCSTMHIIHKKEFTLDDFSHEYSFIYNILDTIIFELNLYREAFIKTKNKDDWYRMIQLLPSGYNQKRTVTMNYENVLNIIKWRSDHKLDEWKTFVDKLERLPYADMLFLQNEEE